MHCTRHQRTPHQVLQSCATSMPAAYSCPLWKHGQESWVGGGEGPAYPGNTATLPQHRPLRTVASLHTQPLLPLPLLLPLSLHISTGGTSGRSTAPVLQARTTLHRWEEGRVGWGWATHGRSCCSSRRLFRPPVVGTPCCTPPRPGRLQGALPESRDHSSHLNN